MLMRFVRPDFDFEGLEDEVPRAWHPAGIGPTTFLEALSALAPVVESFFIKDARRLLPRVAEDALRAEGDAFLCNSVSNVDPDRRPMVTPDARQVFNTSDRLVDFGWGSIFEADPGSDPTPIYS